MALTDEEGWERRVAPTTGALRVMARQALDDLDVEEGGVRWWQGMTSWRHLVLLSDYLIQCLHGAGESLRFASLAAQEHRDLVAATDFDQVKHWTQARRTSDPSSQVLIMTPQNAHARRREARLHMTVEQVLYHLVQCLDRLAPAVLIVGAINVRQVSEAHWGTLMTSYAKLSHLEPQPTAVRAAAHGRFAPAGSPGRSLQEALLEPLTDLDQYGQPDWLAWLRESRNNATHRAPSVDWVILKGKPGRPEGMHSGLARYPKRSDVETLVHLPRTGTAATMARLVLTPSSPDVLEGLLASTQQLVEALAASMHACWMARKADPTLLIQPGRQWADLAPAPELRFEGDGPAVRLLLGKGTQAHMHPDLARRLQAAKFLDEPDGQNRWQREEGD